MMFVKKRPLIFLSIALIILSSIVFFFINKNSYVVIQPKMGHITEAIYGLGKVKSHQRYEVIIGVLTTVQKLYAEEGDAIQKGKPLIKFVDSSIFLAPFTGTVTMVKSKDAETALPNIPILRMENLNDLYIEISLEQEAALRVRKGLKARVSFESIRKNILDGYVEAIYPKEDEFLAHVHVENMGTGVLPGMTVDVSIEIGEKKNAILIPRKAINNGMIEIMQNGKWIKERVKIGHVDATHVEILDNKLGTKSLIRMEKED